MSGILCSGNIVVDLLVRPVDQIRWGASVWVDHIGKSLGGNGANTAYSAAMQETPVRLLGSVGADDDGAFALATLSRAGVDTGFIRQTPDESTARSVVLVKSDGERTFLHQPGVSLTALGAPIDFTSELMNGFRHYHLASPFALPAQRPHAAENLARARRAGLRTSVDTQWDSRGKWMEDFATLLPLTDLLFVNQDECAMLAGTREPETAAEFFARHGSEIVIVKMGSSGCRVFGQGKSFSSCSYQLQAIDTTGAGDCFVGGFLSALEKGRPLEECARLANAVAAMSVLSLGAVNGVGNSVETTGFMQSTPLRPS